MSLPNKNFVTPKTDRLPSLRPPRDMTLSGPTSGSAVGGGPLSSTSSSKPKFVPNLAVAGKRQAATTSDVKLNFESNRGGRGGRSHGARGGRGRGEFDKNRRGRYEPEIIQSKGIFSDGFAEGVGPSKAHREHDLVGGGPSSFAGKRIMVDVDRGAQKSSTTKSEAIETDEMALNELFKDNFICDLVEGDVMPIVVPKVEPKSTQSSTRLKVESVSMKSDAYSNDGATTFVEIFQKAGSTDSEFIFVQLPSVLSDLISLKHPTGREAIKEEIKMEVDESSSTERVNKHTSETEQVENKKKRRLFENVPHGRLGKLQLLKSGQVRLKLSTDDKQKPLYFDVNFAPNSFSQQLVNIHCDELNDGSMCVIADKSSDKMLVTPNIENIVKGLNR